MEELTRRVFVGGLYPTVTETELRELFKSFGNVKDVEIIQRDSGDFKKTFGYINLESTDVKLNQCFALFGKTKWKGYELKVQLAKENFMKRLEVERANNFALPPKKSKRGQASAPVKLYEEISTKTSAMKNALPGTPIQGENNWVVGKYGRALPVVRLQKATHQKSVTVDPSKHLHCLKRLPDQMSDERSLHELTWTLDDNGLAGEKRSSKKRKMPNQQDDASTPSVDDVIDLDQNISKKKKKKKKKIHDLEEDTNSTGDVSVDFHHEPSSNLDSFDVPNESIEMDHNDHKDSVSKTRVDSQSHACNSLNGMSEEDLEFAKFWGTLRDEAIVDEPKVNERVLGINIIDQIRCKTKPIIDHNLLVPIGSMTNSNELDNNDSLNKIDSSDHTIKHKRKKIAESLLCTVSSEDTVCEETCVIERGENRLPVVPSGAKVSDSDVISEVIDMIPIDTHSKKKTKQKKIIEDDLPKEMPASVVENDQTKVAFETITSIGVSANELTVALLVSTETAAVKMERKAKTREERLLKKLRNREAKKKHSISDALRKESLEKLENVKVEQQARANELVQASLRNIDGATAVTNRIVFADSDTEDVDGEDESVEDTKLTSLWSDSEDGEELDNGVDPLDGVERESIQFKVKPQFQGEKGAELFKLQQKFGGDTRFKLDERFADSSLSENEGKDADRLIEYDDDKEEEVVDADLEEENKRALTILEDVLGKSLSKKKNTESAKKSETFERYDPTKIDHERFEIQKAPTEDKETSPKKDIQSDDATTSDQSSALPEVSKETFFTVDPELKNLFSSGANQQGSTFSFLSTPDCSETPAAAMETSDIVTEQPNYHNNITTMETGDPIRRKHANWKKAFDECDQMIDGANEDEYDDDDITDGDSVEQATGQRQGEIATFFFNKDPERLKDAWIFTRTESLEEITSQWKTLRRQLTDDFKTKHKDAVRQMRKLKENRNRR